jgi:hypothetical protein
MESQRHTQADLIQQEVVSAKGLGTTYVVEFKNPVRPA